MLYMGNGQMVEAPYSGEPVRVQPVPWDYRGAGAAGHPPRHRPQQRSELTCRLEREPAV